MIVVLFGLIVVCVICAEKFVIVSYNILAKRYAAKHRDMYVNVPSRYMDWENRRKVICEELIGWNADIICLQVKILIKMLRDILLE